MANRASDLVLHCLLMRVSSNTWGSKDNQITLRNVSQFDSSIFADLYSHEYLFLRVAIFANESTIDLRRFDKACIFWPFVTRETIL